MSGLKTNVPHIGENRNILTDYLDAMLHDTEDNPGGHGQSGDEREAPARLSDATTIRFLKLEVSDKELLLPLSRVRTVFKLTPPVIISGDNGAAPGIGRVERADGDQWLFDLGCLFEHHPGHRRLGVELHRERLALACDRAAEVLELQGHGIRASRDARSPAAWIQAYAVDGLIPIINLGKIRKLSRTLR